VAPMVGVAREHRRGRLAGGAPAAVSSPKPGNLRRIAATRCSASRSRVRLVIARPFGFLGRGGFLAGAHGAGQNVDEPGDGVRVSCASGRIQLADRHRT
jgi:hypothetical protein